MVAVVLMPAAAMAQAAPQPAPAPSIKVGVTVFADYTVTETPAQIDTDRNSLTLHGFNLTRAYINVTGTLTSRVTFRVTPDIVRNSDASGTLSGSLVYRLKYAYGQVRVGERTQIRLGMQPTPLIDGQEAVYRYRFQGTSFMEREGGLSSSDVGLTVLTALPGGYGDVHAGIYNGEGYTKPEVNDQKAFSVRATLKPSPNHRVGKGVRLIGYYQRDHVSRNAPRTRAAASAMFEHARINAGIDVLRRVDQATPASREVTGRGYSLFVTPFFGPKGDGLEGLLRYDVFDADTSDTRKRHRLIGGLAYWVRTQGSGTAALLAHMEQVRERGTTTWRVSERRFALNLLIAF